MAEVTEQPSITQPPAAGAAVSPAGRAGGQSTPGGLQTAKGKTTIADSVVSKVAGIAAREVAGVYKLGGGVARALGAMTQRLADD